MTNQIDRIQNAINHIKTATDIDPWAVEIAVEAMNMAIEVLKAQDDSKESSPTHKALDTISRADAIDAFSTPHGILYPIRTIEALPSVQPEITRCKDCKWWRQQTNYQGTPLSFGFCESDAMWQSLYGETCEVSHIDTDDDFYCGYAERKTDD